uniref:Uncharacterized protein n=1 Tax=Timema poppense TaxID=170557 RepID=A0A7R9DHP1_TIMPO|nr:unnamed protein product [Timema poppensis]
MGPPNNFSFHLTFHPTLPPPTNIDKSCGSAHRFREAANTATLARLWSFECLMFGLLSGKVTGDGVCRRKVKVGRAASVSKSKSPRRPDLRYFIKAENFSEHVPNTGKNEQRVWSWYCGYLGSVLSSIDIFPVLISIPPRLHHHVLHRVTTNLNKLDVVVFHGRKRHYFNGSERRPSLSWYCYLTTSRMRYVFTDLRAL